MKVKSESEVAQSCLTLQDPMDCSPPGSSVHGIFQARVLEWVAIAFSIRMRCCCCCQIPSVVSDSVRTQRRKPTRPPHPWDSPGKNTGVGCHFLLQSNGYIFPFVLCFLFLFFSQLFVDLLRQPFCFFAFLFLGDGLAPCLLYNVMNLLHSSLGILSITSNPLNLFVTSTV